MSFSFDLARVEWFPFNKNLSIFEFSNGEVVTSLFGIAYQTYLVEDKEELVTYLSIDILYVGLLIKTYRDIISYFKKDKKESEDE